MDDRLAAFRALLDAAPEEVVERLYRLVLRRAPEPGVGEDLAARLARGEISPARLLHDLVTSDETTRIRALDDAIAFALHARMADERPRAIPAPPNTDERLVEIPWALSRYRGERRVLDVGYAHAEPAYLAALLAAVPEPPTGVDLVEADVPGFTSVVADLRALPFADDSFDVAFCISTLEHVGQDNRLYGHGPGPVPASDDAMLQALHELRRVALRALVTVPCGRHEQHGWFTQLEPREWLHLFRRARLDVFEHEIYELGPDGWRPASSARGASYGERGPGASAVLCAELRRWTLRRRARAALRRGRDG